MKNISIYVSYTSYTLVFSGTFCFRNNIIRDTIVMQQQRTYNAREPKCKDAYALDDDQKEQEQDEDKNQDGNATTTPTIFVGANDVRQLAHSRL